MSAWSTNGRHNAILADALAAHHLIEATPAVVEHVYEQLAIVNERSLKHRYRNQAVEPRYGYIPGGEVPAVAVMGLAYSWIHQSCEHPGFEHEPATLLVRQLLEHLEEVHGLNPESITTDQLVWSIRDLPAADNNAWRESHRCRYLDDR